MSILSRNSFYIIILLTVVWIILRESFSVITIVTGLAISVCCVLFTRRVIPVSKTEAIKPFRLVVYLFYLFGQIYVGGIAAIKIILFGAHVEVVKIRTKIQNKVLQSILANSMTLVPGSVSLDLSEDVITVLWLMRKTQSAPNIESADELLKGKLERVLIKAQKSSTPNS